MTLEKVSWYWYVGIRDSKTTHVQDPRQAFTPFAHSDLEPHFHKQLYADPNRLWNCEFVEVFGFPARYGFHPQFRYSFWVTTSRSYRSEYTEFDHRMFSSHLPVQIVSYGIMKGERNYNCTSHPRSHVSSTPLCSFLWSESFGSYPQCDYYALPPSLLCTLIINN